MIRFARDAGHGAAAPGGDGGARRTSQLCLERHGERARPRPRQRHGWWRSRHARAGARCASRCRVWCWPAAVFARRRACSSVAQRPHRRCWAASAGRSGATIWATSTGSVARVRFAGARHGALALRVRCGMPDGILLPAAADLRAGGARWRSGCSTPISCRATSRSGERQACGSGALIGAAPRVERAGMAASTTCGTTSRAIGPATACMRAGRSGGKCGQRASRAERRR